MTRLESIWNSWLSLLLKGIKKHEIDCQCIIIMNGWRPDRVWYELSARTTTLTIILLTLAMQQFISFYNDYHILSRRIKIDFHGCLLMLGCVWLSGLYRLTSQTVTKASRKAGANS